LIAKYFSQILEFNSTFAKGFIGKKNKYLSINI